MYIYTRVNNKCVEYVVGGFIYSAHSAKVSFLKDIESQAVARLATG